MKKSLNAWTVDGSVGFEAMFEQVKAAGFDGIELNVDKEGHSAHSLTMATTDEELAAIKALSEKYDLPVVSISSSQYGGKMGSRCAEDREFTKDLLKQQLKCAAALGATGILIVPGGSYPRIPLMEDRKTSMETIVSLKDTIMEYGEKYGIYVGVENVWNGFFTSPLDMATFIDEVDIPYVGAYYDTGNVIAFSWSHRWVEVLGNRIHNIHVKDFKRTNDRINCGGTWEDLTEGSGEWDQIIPALREAGFDGYLTAEVFSDKPDLEYYKKVAGGIEKLIAF